MVEMRWSLASDACKALALYLCAGGGGPAQRFHTLEPGCTMQQRTAPSIKWCLVDEQLQQVVREHTATHEPIQLIAITYVQPADLPQMPQPPQPAQLPLEAAETCEAAIPQRDQPKGARSQEARKRRWGKLKAKRRQRQMGGSLKGTGVEQDDMCLPLHEIAPDAEQATDLLLREASLREQALLQRAEKAEQRATAAEQRATAVRNRSRREIQTAVQRTKQSERSNGKAAGRKRKEKHKAEGWRAARKEEERVRKRKVPTGEALHSGERKHQRLLAESGKTGGPTGKGKGGGGKGIGKGRQ